MKRLMYLFALFSVLVISSCSNELNEAPESESNELIYTTFNMGFDLQYQPITRGVAGLSDVISYLYLALKNTSTNTYTEVAQQSTDADFGTITVGLKSVNHIVTAIGSAGSPTINSDKILSYPDDIVEDTYFYFLNTYNPATTPTQSVALRRVVAMVKINFTDDAIPTKVAKIRFTHSGYTRYSIVSGGPASGSNGSHVVEVAASTTKKEYSFMCFSSMSGQTMAANAEKINVTVEAIDSDNKVLWSKDISDVPIQCNYITTYSGSVFSDNYNDFTVTVDNSWGTGWDINNKLN